MITLDAIIVPLQLDKSDFNKMLRTVSSDAKAVSASLNMMGNAGGDAFAGMAATAMTLISVLALVAAAIAAVVIGAIALTVAIAKVGINLINEMARAVDRTSEYGQQIMEIERLFADVRGATYAAFSPLVEVALPVIKEVVRWIVTALNTLTMYVGAWLGLKQVAQYVEGSAASAESASGQLAGNIQKAGAAAKGALASFDQLNVLTKASAAGSGGGAFTPAFKTINVDIDPKIIDQVAAIRKPFDDLWKSIKDGAIAAWNILVAVWGTTSSWFKTNVTDPLDNLWLDFWHNYKLYLMAFVMNIGMKWGAFVSWFQTDVIAPLGERWTWLVGIWNSSLPVLSFIIIFLIAGFQRLVKEILSLAQSIIGAVAGIVDGVIIWFGGLLEFMQGVFSGNWALMWKGFRDMSTGAFTAVCAFVAGAVNIIIDLVNGMIQSTVAGMNVLIDWLNKVVHTQIPNFTINLIPHMEGFLPNPNSTWQGGDAGTGGNIVTPGGSGGGGSGGRGGSAKAMATGGVIQPNSAFLAMLGDQTSGKNIEAPESLIRQIVREEAGNNHVTIKFEEGNLAGLMRVLKPYADKENSRVGGSLITGGTT